MTQKQQEYYDKWEEVLQSISLEEKLRKAKIVKRVGVRIIRLIIFYLIVPLLKTGSLPKSCQMVNLCYSAVCRMMKNKHYLWNTLFTAVSYELFFVVLADLKDADASYRSRYRIVLAADNSLSPRSNRCTSEGVTKLYDDVTKTYLLSHDIVTLHCIVGDIILDFPLDLRVWKPKENPEYKSKIDLLTEMLETLSTAVEERGLSIEGLDLATDGAYPRGELPKVVDKLKLRLTSKPRSDSSFEITSGELKGEVVTSKELKEQYENCSLRDSSQVSDDTTYERFWATHIATGDASSLGEVVLVLVHYQTKRRIRQEVIFSTHLSYTGPIIIKLKERRWTIEVFYRTVKQVCLWTKAQFQTLGAMTAHWTLRCLTYLLLAVYRYRYCHRSTTIGQIADHLTAPLREKWRVKL